MPILKALDPATATNKTKQLLDGFQKALGLVPNLMRTLANSPAALAGYTSFNAALSQGMLSPQLREQLALAVANANNCDYCLSAHTALGSIAGLNPQQMLAAQQADSTDPKSQAALQFAFKVIENRGQLPASEIDALRSAGFNDAEITEIIGNIALNIFTNYFNHLAGTIVDFPAVRPVHTAA
jgi:uncharacterized peroxidase-related enzyme